MTSEPGVVTPQMVDRIVCADWSSNPTKRAVWEALSGDRLVRAVNGVRWTVRGVLEHAVGTKGRALVAFDAPIGLPASYLAATAPDATRGVPDFLNWLRTAPAGTFEVTEHAAQWTVARPFFRVPAGKGNRLAVEAAARELGVELWRRIETMTRGNSVFITAGIPGSVGGAACDLWRGMLDAEQTGIPFSVWPFTDTELFRLLVAGVPVVAEIYPRAAYATALLDLALQKRPRLRVAKIQAPIRAGAVAALLDASWIKRLGVVIADQSRALNSEDDFDAMITAAALLRCVLDGEPLHPAALHSPGCEGGILGTGSINLDLPEATFQLPRSAKLLESICGGNSCTAEGDPFTGSGDSAVRVPASGTMIVDSPGTARTSIANQLSKAERIAAACNALRTRGLRDAETVLRRDYPFVSGSVSKRQYGPIAMTRVFVRDGFIDRYSGERLVFPPALRLLSAVLPTAFPYHPNWKADVTHSAYWEIGATIDHVVPVSRGGADEESNWVTTSMMRNSAKMLWTLEELGWRLYPCGRMDQWDGMLRWFVEYADEHPALANAANLQSWYRAARASLAVGQDART